MKQNFVGPQALYITFIHKAYYIDDHRRCIYTKLSKFPMNSLKDNIETSPKLHAMTCLWQTLNHSLLMFQSQPNGKRIPRTRYDTTTITIPPC